MIEVMSLLYVGSDADVDEFEELHPDGCIIHAAKEPWHRNAVGYTGRACDKNHESYLFHQEGDELFLNMVDAPDKKYFSKELIDHAVRFSLLNGLRPVLVHCNQGGSRSVLLAMLIMKANNALAPTLEEALDEFEEKYPHVNLGAGAKAWLEEHYETY